MPEQELSITAEQLTRRLDAAIIIYACEQGAIETVQALDPRRIGAEATIQARRAIRAREAAQPIGQVGIMHAMNRL